MCIDIIAGVTILTVLSVCGEFLLITYSKQKAKPLQRSHTREAKSSCGTGHELIRQNIWHLESQPEIQTLLFAFVQLLFEAAVSYLHSNKGGKLIPIIFCIQYQGSQVRCSAKYLNSLVWFGMECHLFP